MTTQKPPPLPDSAASPNASVTRIYEDPIAEAEHPNLKPVSDLIIKAKLEEFARVSRAGRAIASWKLALLAVSGLVLLAVSGFALGGGVGAMLEHLSSKRSSPSLSLPSPPVKKLETPASAPPATTAAPAPSTAAPAPSTAVPAPSTTVGENQTRSSIAVAALRARATVPEPSRSRQKLSAPILDNLRAEPEPGRSDSEADAPPRIREDNPTAPKKLEVASIEAPPTHPSPPMPASPAEPPEKVEAKVPPPPAPVTPLPPVEVDGVVSGTIGPFVPKHAVVWLEGGNLASGGHSKSTPTISQRGARFQPEFLVLTAGQTLVMPNDDRIVHNVFSVSPPKRFDLGHYPEGDSRSVRFETPGVVDLFCNIHDNMHATIVVTPSRFYAIAGSDGHFTIAHVPAGAYRAVAYSPESAIATTSLSVTGGATASVNLALRRR